MATNNIEQFKKFIKKVNKNIKDYSNYKEQQILSDINNEFNIHNCKNSKQKYCFNLQRMKLLLENFIKNNDVKIVPQTTKDEQYLYRSIFRKLAKKYGDSKYYNNALTKLPKKPQLRMRYQKYH